MSLDCITIDVTKQDVRWSSDWVRTGVLSGTLEQHLSRLSQYINEAQWRLQLVTWNEREREEMMRGARGRRKSRKFHQKMASGSGSDWIVGSQGDVESDEDEQAGEEMMDLKTIYDFIKRITTLHYITFHLYITLRYVTLHLIHLFITI